MPKGEARQILAAAAAGRRVLLPGLAELLLSRAGIDDLIEFLPPGARGSDVERVLEALAESDPRQLVLGVLGVAGVRKATEDLGLVPGAYEQIRPVDLLLLHFGFDVPGPSHTDGVQQAMMLFRRSLSALPTAREKPDVRGRVVDVMSAVERLLRLGVWGWAHFAFGPNRDRTLVQLLHASGSTKDTLDRLSFGDSVALFKAIPKALEASPVSNALAQKFGRPGVYESGPTGRRLEALVSTRNKFEHDRNGFYTNSSLELLASEAERATREALSIVDELAQDHAVPRLAVATQEVRDQWGRRSLVLMLDDGTEVRGTFSLPVTLGVPLLYFGSHSNPRPVDPVTLPLLEVGLN